MMNKRKRQPFSVHHCQLSCCCVAVQGKGMTHSRSRRTQSSFSVHNSSLRFFLCGALALSSKNAEKASRRGGYYFFFAFLAFFTSLRLLLLPLATVHPSCRWSEPGRDNREIRHARPENRKCAEDLYSTHVNLTEARTCFSRRILFTAARRRRRERTTDSVKPQMNADKRR